MPLTPDQQGYVDRARKVLAEPHGYTEEDLAARLGKVEYWLREMIMLVVEVAGEPPGNVSSITRKYGG